MTVFCGIYFLQYNFNSNRSVVIAFYTLYCNTKCVTDTLVTLLRQERNICEYAIQFL